MANDLSRLLHALTWYRTHVHIRTDVFGSSKSLWDVLQEGIHHMTIEDLLVILGIALLRFRESEKGLVRR